MMCSSNFWVGVDVSMAMLIQSPTSYHCPLLLYVGSNSGIHFSLFVVFTFVRVESLTLFGGKFFIFYLQTFLYYFQS